MPRKKTNWFNKQPVSVRAALIIATASIIVGVLSFWADWRAHTVKFGENAKFQSIPIPTDGSTVPKPPHSEESSSIVMKKDRSY